MWYECNSEVASLGLGNLLPLRRGANTKVEIVEWVRRVLGWRKGEQSEQYSKDFHIVAILEKKLGNLGGRREPWKFIYLWRAPKAGRADSAEP